MKDLFLPIVFMGLGALLIWLLFGNKKKAEQAAYVAPYEVKPGATDVPENKTPDWILLSNAASNYNG